MTFKQFLLVAILFAGIGAGSSSYYFISHEGPAVATARDMEAPITVHFSPKGGCTETVVEAINQARTEILVQAYSFTSQPIEDALIAAKKDRNVKVRVILDRSQYDAKSAAAMPLYTAGIEVMMDNKHSIAHNKIMIIDGAKILTGSFNFTRQAEISNAENLLVINSPDLAKAYATNWDLHFGHSDVYSGETSRPRK